MKLNLRLSRRSLSRFLVVAVVAGAAYYTYQRRVGADVVGDSPQIIGLANTHLARLENRGTSPRSAVLSLHYLVKDADQEMSSSPRDVIVWGDGSGYDYLTVGAADQSVSYLKTAGSTTGYAYAVNRTHVYAQPGVYQAYLRVYDSNNNMSEQAFTVVVADEPDTGSTNYPPSVSLVDYTDVAFTGQVLYVSAVTDDFSELGSTRNLAVDWGDGGQETVSVPVEENRSVTTFYHDYATPGDYLATFVVQDEQGEMTTLQHLYIVREALSGPKIISDLQDSNLSGVTGDTLRQHVVAIDLDGENLTLADRVATENGGWGTEQAVEPTMAFSLFGYYDKDARARFFAPKVAEYNLTRTVGAEESFSRWGVIVRDDDGIAAEESFPITMVNVGEQKVMDRFDQITSYNQYSANCAGPSEQGWIQSGLEERASVIGDYNPYRLDASNGNIYFKRDNCRLTMAFRRASSRSALTRVIDENRVYAFGPGSPAGTRLVAEFDAYLGTDPDGVMYVGFGDSAEATAWPAVGVKLFGTTAGSGQVAAALYQLNGQGVPEVGDTFFTAGPDPSGVDSLYRFSLVLDRENRLLVWVRDYRGKGTWDDLVLAEPIVVNALRFTDDGTKELPGKDAVIFSTIDNVSLIATGDKARAVTPTTVETPAPASVVTPATPASPAAVAQPSARELLVSGAERQAVARSAAATDKLKSLQQELQVARSTYTNALRSGDKAAAAAAKREVNRLNREISKARTTARRYAERLRLVTYSKNRLAYLERANAQKEVDLRTVRAQLDTARAEYRAKKTWNNYYRVRRLSSRVTALQWRFNYNQRMIKFHEQRLQREANEQ